MTPNEVPSPQVGALALFDLGNGDPGSAIRLNGEVKGFDLRMLLEEFMHPSPEFTGAFAVDDPEGAGGSLGDRVF